MRTAGAARGRGLDPGASESEPGGKSGDVRVESRGGPWSEGRTEVGRVWWFRNRSGFRTVPLSHPGVQREPSDELDHGRNGGDPQADETEASQDRPNRGTRRVRRALYE